ncbi:MAG: HAD hydrolase-like protein [Planctomycetes bacterium]|nr:HAD hydrolase-like protein [Planctomycetota bacterium]
MHICLFDIDGTLIHTRGAGMIAMRNGLRNAFQVARPTDSVAVHGRTDRGITRDMFQAHGIDDTTENWQRLRDAYYQLLPESLTTRPGVLLPGVTELLETLTRRSDVAVGLLTGNAQQGARIKLAHFGIEHYFRFGGFGDQHFERDDVAREALTAARQHVAREIDLDRVWVIGDTPTDVSCGRAIGARTIAVLTGNHSRAELEAAHPDLLLDDLTDHTPLLALWN